MNQASSFPQQYGQTRRFTLGAPRTVSVSGDGSSVFFLRSQSEADPVLCLWKLEVATGTESLLADPAAFNKLDNKDVPAAELARRERARESADGIVSYTLNRDASLAVFALAGALYTVDTATGVVQNIPAADGVFDPRINATGTHIAYVSGQDLHLASLDSRTETWDSEPVPALASDEDPLVSWGRAEFIAGEEMQRTRGFWWSPEGDCLLVTRVDENPIEQRWISDPANPDRQPNEVRYPAAGTANAIVDLAKIELDGSTSLIPWREDRFEYLANVVWPTGKQPLLVRQTRDQRTVSICDVLFPSGPGEPPSLSEVRRIEDATWVELVPGSPSPCAHGLLTIEDLTAADHRAVCLDGVVISPPTMQIRKILAVEPNHVLVAFSTDPTETHLARLSLIGEEPEVLTSEPGVHSATCGGSTLVMTSAHPEKPGSTISVLTAQNPSGDVTIPSFAQTPVLQANPTYVELGKSGLASALFVPEDHDGVTPLPVLLDPYGGPHAQRVVKAQNAHLVSQWFANQGFAVLVTDGRGTPGRGPAFERAVWGDLAQPVLDDQIEALDAAGDAYNFLDLTRVGIRGWSFGGYLAALAVLRRPDRFHAAIAGAPVTSWGLYDTHYTERYLGHPDNFPHHYKQSDLLDEAAGLGSPLLLIHGLADDNVVAAHTLRLSSALLAAGRSHQVLPLSGVTHMTPQAVVAENLLHLQRDFLTTALQASTHS